MWQVPISSFLNILMQKGGTFVRQSKQRFMNYMTFFLQDTHIFKYQYQSKINCFSPCILITIEMLASVVHAYMSLTPINNSKLLMY